MQLVSIHAPARGATQQPEIVTVNIPVSIHAPARGATTWSPEAYPAGWVSIHAPARGATQWQMAGVDYTEGFNPRTREGCDSYPAVIALDTKVSIHAPARGATGLKWR